MSFSCFGIEPITLALHGRAAEALEFVTPQHVQQPLIQAIVDALQGDNRPSQWLSTGAVALRTQLAMDAALHDFYGGREDGCWSGFGEDK